MISKQMEEKLNDQFMREIYSSHIYLAIASYFQSLELDGFASFFKRQANEETGHAMKIFEYVHSVEGTITVPAIPAPATEFKDPLHAVEEAYAHEKKVTAHINELVDHARAEGDNATFAFLQWFVTEQIEEESTFKKLSGQLRTMPENRSILYILDGRLSQATS